jgi:hypothetical protein
MSRPRYHGHRHHGGTHKIQLNHDHSHRKGFSEREKVMQECREAHVVQIVACVAAPFLGIGAIASQDARGLGFLFGASCVIAVGAYLYRRYIRYVYKVRE